MYIQCIKMSRKRKSHEDIREKLEIINEDTYPKIVLLGDSNTGKSTFFNFLKQKTENGTYKFNKNHVATKMFDIAHIKLNINNSYFTDISLWDTAGQENYSKLSKDYLRGADGVIIMYDVNESQTTKNVMQKWLQQVKATSPNVPVAVLCNKCDTLEGNKSNLHKIYIRDSKLKSSYECENIKNFNMSIKANQNYKENSEGFFSTSYKYEKNGNCLKALEYILTNIAKKNDIKKINDIVIDC